MMELFESSTGILIYHSVMIEQQQMISNRVFEVSLKIEGLLLLVCGYLSFIVGNFLVIIQLCMSSTMNSLCGHVFYMTASQSCMLLIIVMIHNMKLK